jgi:outer membrane protein assembly factor BamB
MIRTSLKGRTATRNGIVTMALALLVLAVSGAVTAVIASPRVIPHTPTPATDWPGYLRDVSHSSYNAGATAITPSNTSQLAPTWKWIPPASPNSATTSLLASPTVVNGVIYQGVKDGYNFAINQSTGAPIWNRFLAINTPLPPPPAPPSCGVGDYQGIISTATVTTDPNTNKLTVYVYAPDGFLYALDAANGALVWKGQVFTPSTQVNDYYSWGSPLVANGKVYIGVSSDCDNPLVPGGLASFDQSTGAPVARWTSVPAGQVGGSIWSSPAMAADGSIIATTGNGRANSGQPLYNESIVRLDPNSLAVLDAWQVPASQQHFDGDFGASPTMFTALLNGVSTPMVGACNKNGYYYAFKQNALSAGYVWRTPITIPYPGGAEECDSAAVWDGTHLIETGGAPTPQPIGGNNYMGSIQSLNPATGVPLWQSGLNGTIVGSPTEDGSGVVAAPTYQTCTPTGTPCVPSSPDPGGQLGVYLVSATTGAVVGFLPTPKSPLFGQPVFVGNQLLLGAGSHLGLTAYQVSNTGGSITVSPNSLATNTVTPVTITSTLPNFSGSPVVTVSSDGVTAGTATVVDSTHLTVNLTVSSTASAGPRDVSVSIPGSPPTVDSCTGCLTITQPSPPSVTSVNPTTLGQNSNIANFVIHGNNFAPGAAVSFSSTGVTATSVTYISPTALSATVNVAPNFSSALGPSDVTVTTTGGSGTCTACVTIDLAPDPTGVAPSVVSGHSTPITVAGTDFHGGLVVSSTVPGATFSAPGSVTSTSFNTTVTVPAGTAPGSYDLTVTNPDGGTGTCTGCLTVTGAPVLPPIPPNQGSLGAPVTGMASTPVGDGYWLTNGAGAVSPHGAAPGYGSLAGHPLNAPIDHIVATPDGKGYWLVASDGGTFTFGDAGFYGSMGGQRLNAPVVDLAPTSDGKGYWLVASDGGVFSFGDAAFHGSTGNLTLNRPVVGISADDATGGYWLVASDGGVFSFGAPFFGSTGNLTLNRPVNGMAVTADGGGYWFVASDGGIFSFGDAVFHGSTGNLTLNAPIAGMAGNASTGGYWLVAYDGGVFSFGAPFYGAD